MDGSLFLEMKNSSVLVFIVYTTPTHWDRSTDRRPEHKHRQQPQIAFIYSLASPQVLARGTIVNK